MKYLKEEQRIIVGKKVKIKICETPKDGRFLAKALPLKTIPNAIAIRNKIIHSLEYASFMPHEKEQATTSSSRPRARMRI